MDTKDNPGAPVIPAGTQPTAFGGKSFNSNGTPFSGNAPLQNQGQGTPSPAASFSQNATQSQDAPEGTTFADLAAKKGFASPDDLAKAYANLETHNKRVEMTAADILKEISPVPAQAPVAPPQPVSPDDAAINIVKSIVQSETRPLQQQIELQNLFMKNPDAVQYAPGLAKAVKENPGISWEGAYKIAKFDSLEQSAQKNQQVQRQQTDQLRTQTLVGSPSPTERGGPDVRSIIKDRSVPFKEVDRIVRDYLTQSGQ